LTATLGRSDLAEEECGRDDTSRRRGLRRPVDEERGVTDVLESRGERGVLPGEHHDFSVPVFELIHTTTLFHGMDSPVRSRCERLRALTGSMVQSMIEGLACQGCVRGLVISSATLS